MAIHGFDATTINCYSNTGLKLTQFRYYSMYGISHYSKKHIRLECLVRCERTAGF